MLPRAAVVDSSPLAALRPLAWWRARGVLGFVAGHCATAGVVWLGALLVDLLRAGKPLPAVTLLVWSALGLAILAAVPAGVTLLLRELAPPRTRRGAFAQALGVGLAIYGVLPAIFADSIRPIAVLLPVAIGWHAVLALAPTASSSPGAATPSRPSAS